MDGDKGSDPVDDVQLPDTATPKSAEAFQKVKDIARQQVAEAQQKLVDLQRKNDELKRKVDEGLTPEAKQELEQLREFRTKLDIEVDPQFQQYNEKIASASEFVYAQLKKAGLGEEVVDKIKEFGGPHKVNMDKILEKVDDRQVERLVNSKIADIEQFDFDKGQAIEKAKSNVQEYLQERAQQIEQGSVQHRQATRQILDSNILSNMNFLKEPKPLKDDATEDEKKLYGAQKEFVKAAKGHVDKMLSDDSPEMRAIMAGGVVKMLHLNTVVNAQKAIIDGKDETIESLTKERDDAVALAERLKKGSVNHRRRSNAPETGTQVPAPSYDPNQPTEHALDQLARQVSQHRNAGVS